MAKAIRGNSSKDDQLIKLINLIIDSTNVPLLKNGNKKLLKELQRASGHLSIEAGYAVVEKIEQSIGGVKSRKKQE